MSDKPSKVSFSQLVERGVLEIGDGYRAKLDELGGDGPIFLRAGLLTERGVEWELADRFQADLVPRLKTKLGVPGDTVVTTKGNSIGRTWYVPEDAPEFVYSPHLSFWRSRRHDQLDSLFLRYWAMSSDFGLQLEAMAGSTDMAPYLSLTDQYRLRIALPGVAVQKSVGEILGALDDKIAVNDRIQDASDRLAASLLDRILADDSDCKSVPVAEIARVNQRKVGPIEGGYLRYLDISSVSAGRIDWPNRLPWSEAPGRARRGIQSGDTIWSTVRPGRRSFAMILDRDPELVASTGFAVLTPVHVGPAFLYEITKRDDFVQYLESVAEGSAYPAVRAERFERAVIFLPSQRRLEYFESIAFGLRQRVHAAQCESRGLAGLRETLLPRLMSGKIRVQKAEKIVEDAT